MDLAARPLHPLFVAEIGGVDAGHPLDAATVRDLRRVTTRDVASTLDQVA
jgi:hypothetical protein